MTKYSPTRRAFLGSSATAMAAAPALLATSDADAQVRLDEDFVYEITRTEEEWREMLTEEQYRVMREFGTEQRFSSPLWEEERDGEYACRGCDLKIYDNTFKETLFIGWLFFDHAEPATVLMGIDGPVAEYGERGMSDDPVHIEAHCRRCGSHLGHILYVEGRVRHCINGNSLVFRHFEA